MQSPGNRLGLRRLADVDYAELILAAPADALIRQPDPIFLALEEVLRRGATLPRRAARRASVETVLARYRDAIARQDARREEQRREREERLHHLRTAPLDELIAAARRKRDFLSIARARGLPDAWAHHRMLDMMSENRRRIWGA